MIRLQCLLLLPFTAMLALGQSAHPSPPASPNQPIELVRSLYTQVLARHLSDIPDGADMKLMAPYLSKALLHKMDLAKACSNDQNQNHPKSRLDAAMASKYGLFSGEFWYGNPQTFKIKKAESHKDGSMQVNVTLKSRESKEFRDTSEVAVIVLREGGRYAVDDVIYINDSFYDYPEEKPADQRLSEYLAAGCNGPHWIGYSLPNQPEVFIHSLYEHVLARPRGGIPSGVDWKIYEPYMSKSLLHRIDDFDACSADWFRLHHDPKHPEKAPFGVYESGIFSGDDELTGPRAFAIEKTQPEKDGFIRVYVRLAWWDAPVNKRVEDQREYTSAARPLIWHVAPIVVRESGRLVVDDVIFLKDAALHQDADWRLSQSLSQGCDGPRWVGYNGQ